MTLYDWENGDILGAVGGNAYVLSEQDSDGNLSSSSNSDYDWQGFLSQDGDEYTLDYDYIIDFDAEVGKWYGLYFDLATSTWSSAGNGDGWGKSGTFALADFANTGALQLYSTCWGSNFCARDTSRNSGPFAF